MRLFRRRKFEGGEFARFFLLYLLVGGPLLIGVVAALDALGLDARHGPEAWLRIGAGLFAAMLVPELDHTRRRRRYSAPGVPGTTGRSGSSTWNDAPSPGDDST